MQGRRKGSYFNAALELNPRKGRTDDGDADAARNQFAYRVGGACLVAKPAIYVCFGKNLIHPVTVDRITAVGNELFAFEVFWSDLRFRTQAMSFGENTDGLSPQDRSRHHRWAFHWQCGESEVTLAGSDVFKHPLGSLNFERNRHIGVSGIKSFENRSDKHRYDARDGDDP